MKTKPTTRAPTGDRGRDPPLGRAPTSDILTREQIGPRMSRLPNGALLCREVPIARVGTMLYGPNETPIKVGDYGVAHVERTADELFSPETMASFAAAAVVDEHPGAEFEGEVNPRTWSRLAKGFSTTNVRRGTGDNADVLLADLVITDKSLISSILAGKREVSCGYDADYTQTGPGRGRQTNIIGNHIALVERGRCGPRCAIGDRATQPPEEGNQTMSTKRVKLLATARQKVSDAQAEVDELELAEAVTGQDEDESGIHVHVHTGDEGAAPVSKKTEDRLSAIETAVGTLSSGFAELMAMFRTADDGETAEEKATREAAEAAVKAKVGDGAADEGDSKALQTSYEKTLAQAEVLVPGFRMPTFDAAAKRKVTVDSMCAARRRCLDLAYATNDGKTLIDGIVGGADTDVATMDCAAVAVTFSAASVAKAAMNNRAATGDGTAPSAKHEAAPARPSAAQINEQNEKFWASQQQAA